MGNYEDYISMNKKAVWMLYYSGLITLEEFNNIKERFYKMHSEYEEKRAKAMH